MIARFYFDNHSSIEGEVKKKAAATGDCWIVEVVSLEKIHGIVYNRVKKTFWIQNFSYMEELE